MPVVTRQTTVCDAIQQLSASVELSKNGHKNLECMVDELVVWSDADEGRIDALFARVSALEADRLFVYAFLSILLLILGCTLATWSPLLESSPEL